MKKFLLFIFSFLIIINSAMASSLNKKERSIAIVSANASIGNQEELKKSIEFSLDSGVSVNELKEILVQLYAYCGFPRSLNALSTLMSVVEKRSDKINFGKEPSKKPEGNPLIYGEENQTKLVGAEVKGKLFDFVPVIDEFLKSHLFGDIFVRDNIDWKTRELATISMLAVRDGVDSQLNSHIQIGKHNGLTDEQINEILSIANETKAKNVIFGFGEENPYGKYFTGKNYLEPITTEGIPMFNVTFEPKCRNNWHIHHGGGQILLATSGRGYFQEWGKPARELKPGDRVVIPAGVKHWHGAAKNSWFTHIAVEIPGENSKTEWLEKVSDEEYNKLK